MKTRKLGTLDETSLLGFGCMRFPVKEDGSIDEQEATRLLEYAYAHGVTYYDTAYPYHDEQSELFLGKFLQTKPRNSFYVATKLPIYYVKNKEDVSRYFEEQLARLQVEYVDYYLIHALSNERFDLVLQYDVLSVLEEYQKQGKIRHLGFSFHDEYRAFERIINAYPWQFCQLQLNYMDMDIQAGRKGYELAKAKQIPVIVMEPVKGGTLASLPPDLRSLVDAEHADWSSAGFALRYVASYDYVQVVLSGMSSYEQVVDNIMTFADFEPMTKQDQVLVTTIEQQLKSRIAVPCTNCQYCLPCPNGVAIPRNFRIFNEGYRFDNFTRSQWLYDQLEDGQKASNCISCQECVPKCPQFINIPAELERIRGVLK